MTHCEPTVDFFELPAFKVREKIVRTVQENPVTIIFGDLGCGKSTQTSLALAELGRYRTLCAEPTKQLCVSLCSRVADQHGTPIGSFVGYETALNKCATHKSQVVFMTQGLAYAGFVRSLMDNPEGVRGQKNRVWDFDVVCIDEAHHPGVFNHWLIALAEHEIRRGTNQKYVIMTATPNIHALKNIFPDSATLEIEGRGHYVEDIEPVGSVVQHALDLMESTRSGGLVFEPGKPEIEKDARLINESDPTVCVLPLHSEMPLDEQQRVVEHEEPIAIKLITNCGESGNSPSGVGFGIDSGFEKIRVTDPETGVEGLFTVIASQQSFKQRRGRLGRRGVCDLFSDHCPVQFKNRPEFSSPEHSRVRLDMFLLQCAVSGIDIHSLKFEEPIPQHIIYHGYRSLKALGLMNEAKDATQEGKDVVRLGLLNPSYGKMILHAFKENVVPYLVVISGIYEAGTIIKRDCGMFPEWQSLVSDNFRSELLTQLELFVRALNFGSRDFKRYGVDESAFFRAKETSEILTKNCGIQAATGYERSRELDNAILRSVLAGSVDRVYSRISGPRFKNIRMENDIRELPRKNSINPDCQYIIGLPFDIRSGWKEDSKIEKIVCLPSEIEESWLSDFGLIKEKSEPA